jgi:allophanate hydrolase subunit 2
MTPLLVLGRPSARSGAIACGVSGRGDDEALCEVTCGGVTSRSSKNLVLVAGADFGVRIGDIGRPPASSPSLNELDRLLAFGASTS